MRDGPSFLISKNCLQSRFGKCMLAIFESPLFNVASCTREGGVGVVYSSPPITGTWHYKTVKMGTDRGGVIDICYRRKEVWSENGNFVFVKIFTIWFSDSWKKVTWYIFNLKFCASSFVICHGLNNESNNKDIHNNWIMKSKTEKKNLYTKFLWQMLEYGSSVFTQYRFHPHIFRPNIS